MPAFHSWFAIQSHHHLLLPHSWWAQRRPLCPLPGGQARRPRHRGGLRGVRPWSGGRRMGGQPGTPGPRPGAPPRVARGDQVHRSPVSVGDGNNCAVDGFFVPLFSPVLPPSDLQVFCSTVRNHVMISQFSTEVDYLVCKLVGKLVCEVAKKINVLHFYYLYFHHSLKFIKYINAQNWPNCSSVERPRIFPPTQKHSIFFEPQFC